MKFARIAGLVLALTTVGLAVVSLRAEQTRCAATMLRIESERVRMRRELWSLKARLARLRSPDRIAQSAQRVASDLAPPFTVSEPAGSGRKDAVVHRSTE